jgi:hypothetical protein
VDLSCSQIWGNFRTTIFATGNSLKTKYNGFVVLQLEGAPIAKKLGVSPLDTNPLSKI